MSTSKTLAVAALTGLLSVGAFGAASASSVDHPEKAAAMQAEKEKHACKGQNSCKGNGADGKNSCKGKGSCATDGSKPAN